MRRIIALLLLPVSAMASELSQSPRFFDVKVGLADLEAGKIYRETDSSPYIENGTCTANGKRVKCLQWALEYSYENVVPGSILSCVVTTGRPVTRVDVSSSDSGETLLREEGSIPMPKSDGYEFIPAYVIKEPGDVGVFVTTYQCHLAGLEVINKSFAVDTGGL